MVIDGLAMQLAVVRENEREAWQSSEIEEGCHTGESKGGSDSSA